MTDHLFTLRVNVGRGEEAFPYAFEGGGNGYVDASRSCALRLLLETFETKGEARE